MSWAAHFALTCMLRGDVPIWYGGAHNMTHYLPAIDRYEAFAVVVK